MADISGSNAPYLSYINRLAGSDASYTTGFLETDGYNAFMVDNADVTPDNTHVFVSSYAAGDDPNGITNYVDLQNPIAGSISTGSFTVDTFVFEAGTGTELVNPTALDSLVFARNLSDSAATSPLMVHIGSATGIPLTPNGADVTAVPSASGLWKIGS